MDKENKVILKEMQVVFFNYNSVIVYLLNAIEVLLEKAVALRFVRRGLP